MRKLMKIEVSEERGDLLATDNEGNEYPIELETMLNTAKNSGEILSYSVECHIQVWLSCSGGYKKRNPSGDWKTIYKAEQ